MNDIKPKENKSRYVRALTVLSVAVIFVMIALCVYFVSKYNLTLSNIGTVAEYISGGTLTLVLLFIGLNILRSFTMVFPPAVLYVLAGMVFGDFFTAVAVNAIASVFSLFLPYYIGKITGIETVSYLREKFSSVRKLDDFAGSNSFAVVFFVKVGLIPSDLSSLIFGAMNIHFGTYFLSSNLAMLVLNLLWTLLGVKGDFSDPRSYIYALPAVVFAVLAVAALGLYAKKKNKESIKK